MGGILFDLSTRLPENGLFLNAHHAALRDVPSMIMIIEGKSHSDTRELIAQKNICSMTCAQLLWLMWIASEHVCQKKTSTCTRKMAYANTLKRWRACDRLETCSVSDFKYQSRLTLWLIKYTVTKTWPIPSGTRRSRQYYDLLMVGRHAGCYPRTSSSSVLLPLVTLFSLKRHNNRTHTTANNPYYRVPPRKSLVKRLKQPCIPSKESCVLSWCTIVCRGLVGSHICQASFHKEPIFVQRCHKKAPTI